MNRCKATLSACVLTFCLVLAPAGAHHGGGSYWDRDSQIGPITGTATRLAFVFPHVTIYFDAEDENGNVEDYAMSIRWTPTVLRDIGWNRRTIVAGDEVTVTYVPHKQDPTVGSLISLEVNGEPTPIGPEE